MSYRTGTYILISDKGTVFGLYRSPGAAKGVRTSCLKGRGAIYFVVTGDGFPRLDLEDQK